MGFSLPVNKNWFTRTCFVIYSSFCSIYRYYFPEKKFKHCRITNYGSFQQKKGYPYDSHTILTIERPNNDGKWPSEVERIAKEEDRIELLKEQIQDVLDTLTDRENRVLQLRFGLEDGRGRTLEEVGFSSLRYII